MTRSGLLAAEKRSLEIISMTAEGDRVAYEAKGEMVFPDRVYSNSYHNLLVIRDGLIVEGREYMDTMAVARAFGWILLQQARSRAHSSGRMLDNRRATQPFQPRSAERRVGTECGRRCRTRWRP